MGELRTQFAEAVQSLDAEVASCVEINQCVGWIEQASRRWRGGRRDDSARTPRKM